MKMLIVFFCALLVAGSASAQGLYNIAKQQARNAAGGESGGGRQATMSPATPAPADSPQPNPALEATLQNIENLHDDFGKLDSNPTNTQPLINDLTAAARGAQAKPASISQLSGHLAAVLAGNKKLQAQAQKLAQYVHAIFNGSHLSAAQQQMVIDGAQKILQDGGVSSDNVADVINDLKTIATETK